MSNFGFGFSGSAAASAPAAGGATQGPDLELIQAEGLGFLSIAGDSKVRLTAPWSPLPSPTASLLSIAPRKGLVAAAGPDTVILATTELVRKAFDAPKVDEDSDVRNFDPQLKIPVSTRVSQLAFTADENHLIMSAEAGGGLAVYDVQAMLNGATRPAFEMATNGLSLRSLVPNPMADKADQCALITTDGSLLMAWLGAKRAITTILDSQVTCATWSTKGKQLVAGKADGSIVQLTPEGAVKAEIPKPAGLGDYHVSSIAWLENDLFLTVHTSTNEQPPSYAYHIITRQAQAGTIFQKLADPVDPFGAEKPAHHTILRLKGLDELQDILLVCSTASTDIGLITRSSVPLTSEVAEDKIKGVFTTTELSDDSRRAQLPMSEEMDNTIPIGAAIDLSSKEHVFQPIPGDEIEFSTGPLPGYWVLNNEGVLLSWWIVYNASVRKGTTYPGFAALEGAAPAPTSFSATATAPPAQQTTTAPAFGAAAAAPAFGTPSTAPAFGTPSTIPAFGAPSSIPAFGAPSALSGPKASLWGTPQTTTTPSAPATQGAVFGQSSAFGAAAGGAFGKPGTAFGQSSSIGLRASPWAAASSGGGGSVFGGSPAAPAANAPGSGGFASFANKGGFAAVGSEGSGGGNIFASKPSGLFGSGPSDISMDSETAFRAPSTAVQPTPTAGGFSSTPFQLGTTFVASKDDNEPTKDTSSGRSTFSNLFGSALNDTAKQTTANVPASKDEDMDEGDTGVSSKLPAGLQSTTPTTTPEVLRLSDRIAPPTTGALSGGLSGGLFNTTGLFGAPKPSSPFALGSGSSTKPTVSAPIIKAEPEDITLSSIPEAPLPPDTTSKAQYTLGDSSSSSAGSNLSPEITSRFTEKVAETSPLPSEASRTKLPAVPAVPDPPAAATPTPNFLQPKGKAPAEATPLPPDFLKPKPMDTTEAMQLPPDFLKPKPKAAVESSPLPPDFLKPKPKAGGPEAAPLPPDFVKPKKKASYSQVPPPPLPELPKLKETPRQQEPPLPPVSTKKTPPHQLPPPPAPSPPHSDEGGLSDGDGASELGSEGSGIDVGKDVSPSQTGQTPGLTPQSSFGMVGSGYSTITRPDPPVPRLFGEISRNTPMFPQPNLTSSPRSPSPVRGAIPARMGMDATRSVSAPGMASQILGKKLPPGPGASLIGVPQVPPPDKFVEQQRRARAKKDAEEAQLLVDREDEEIQKILKAPLRPTTQLDEFIAHNNSAGPGSDSIPAQVEAVYRDINSMIDTLGLNARALSSFIAGHSEGRSAARTKEDLDIPDDWVLCEAEDLDGIVEEELAQDLADAEVTEIEEKKDVIGELLRDMTKLRAKQDDLRKVISARVDPEQAAVLRSLPLSAEQAAQQNDLRRSFAAFSRRLAEAEEALSMLKVRLASANAAAGGGGPGATAAPTVEAVMRTISKMTGMVEKRSGDVDVLETQLRKLRIAGGGGPASREGSPFHTPPPKRGSLIFSPDNGAGGGSTTPRHSHLRNSLSGSPASFGARGTPPRKKLTTFTEEDKAALKDKRAKKQAVLDKLKASLEKNGPNVWPMDDIE